MTTPLFTPYRDGLLVSGKVHVYLTAQNGRLILSDIGDNLVVNGGRTLLLNQLVGGLTANRPYTTQPIAYIALGNSTTPVAATQTALSAEEPGPNGVRKLATVTSPQVGQLLLTAVWGQTENQNTTINEIGIFTNSTSGGNDIMFSRYVLLNPIPKDAFTNFQVAYTINLGAS